METGAGEEQVGGVRGISEATSQTQSSQAQNRLYTCCFYLLAENHVALKSPLQSLMCFSSC